MKRPASASVMRPVIRYLGYISACLNGLNGIALLFDAFYVAAAPVHLLLLPKHNRRVQLGIDACIDAINEQKCVRFGIGDAEWRCLDCVSSAASAATEARALWSKASSRARSSAALSSCSAAAAASADAICSKRTSPTGKLMIYLSYQLPSTAPPRPKLICSAATTLAIRWSRRLRR